jgi:sialate O-acetylesterase
MISLLLGLMLLWASALAAPKNKAAPKDEARPAFRLAGIFGDNMVLQQEKPIRVWGWAPAGAAVSVTLTQDARIGEKAEAEAGPAAAAPAPRVKPKDQGPELPDVTMQYVEANPPSPINETLEVAAGADGKWLVEFKPAKASFRPTWIVARSGGNTLAVRNVLIGEIWLCAGQSNMAWSNYNRKDREAPSDDFPALRYVQWDDSWYKPLDDVRTDLHWRACTPENAQSFSAVPYLYGLFLHRYLKAPVGIINVARGGTLGQTWCMRDQLDNIDNVIIKTVLKDYDAECAAWNDPKQVEQKMGKWKADCDAAQAKYKEELAKYNESIGKPKEAPKEEPEAGGKGKAGSKAKAKAAAKADPGAPREPRLRLPKQPGDPRGGWSPPAGLFNATVMPIRQFGIRGVLYYQGENQAFGLWTRYEYTFPKIPVSFRKAFGDEDLWFGCISQPGWGNFGEDPEVSAARGGYHIVRDIQHRALKNDAHAGMIATYPTGNSYIHPAEKLPVAEYSCLWALAKVYEKPVVHFGTRYREFKARDGKIYLYFDVDPMVEKAWEKATDKAAWMVLPCPYQGNADFEGFTIAGADRRWYPARGKHVKLDGQWTIELSSDLCKEPVAARYGWAQWPTGNMVGRENLPLPTFRTDDWPLPVAVKYNKEVQEQADAKLAADLLTAQKQALDRKIRQAMIDLPKLEAELYAGKLQRDARKLVESKIARLEAVLDELQGKDAALAKSLQKSQPELAGKLAAARKAVEELKAEAAKIEP